VSGSWGFVHGPTDPTAAYFVQWAIGRVTEHGANFDRILGQWGEEVGAADRSLVALAYRLTDTGPAAGAGTFFGRGSAKGRDAMDLPARFDANEYYKSGNCPWTFFAFPRGLADAAGFPPDDDAKRLFLKLQGLNVPVGIWTNSPVEDTVYFACPKEAIGRLNDALRAMEAQGEFEEGFCAKRSEYLFSL
jgi:hypothetical protein